MSSLLKDLLEKGADLKATNINGMTALHIAVDKNAAPEVAELLRTALNKKSNG